MKHFIDKHQTRITGTISCFDRILFKGHLPLSWDGAMESFIARQGLKIKEFKDFVSRQSDRLKAHAKAIAERAERPYVYLNRPIRKEARARAIAEQDGITEGLVCILAAVEACQSFKIAYGEQRPRIVPARRKCLCLYFYFIDREFGFMHVRITSWFPFTVQVCLNGHDWLARKMDRHGIAYRQLDNAFLWIDRPQRAQRFADRFAGKNWPRILSALARRVNPLMRNLLKDMDYYWVTEQAEFATDVMFENRAALKDLYENLLRHATHCFSAEDVMTFLGRKLNGNFMGEILNDYKKRWPGARIRHRMKENWIKMYDKHGSVLRIETVINRPYEFKVRRQGIRKGKKVLGWYPMAKRVTNLRHYAEVSLTANRRYLDALAIVGNPSEAKQDIQRLARPVRRDGRSHRGFNPAARDDVRLFAAAMRGEHNIRGFRNADIRHQLYKPAGTPDESRRQSARTSRLLKRLHVHGLIAKIPRSRRWRVTTKGQKMMSMVLIIHHNEYPEVLMRNAA
ncbi:MAG: hypothetical protein ACE5EQ_12570 [Phycisphaerae bacterium]